MNKKEISVLTALVITFLFSLIYGTVVSAENIKQTTLRLHIIANSNSEYDQNIKMQIKEQILNWQDILPQSNQTFEEALVITKDNLPKIKKRANDFLKKQNVGYKADCTIENFYFDTTKYSNFTLPQGEYMALTVRLGKAEGKNWWCVVYPQLCSVGCGDIKDEENGDFIANDGIMVRFKVVEIYENIKGHFEKRAEKYTKIQP